MDNQMTRVQVYLEPQSVTQLDVLAKTIRVKRSQIIREAVLAVNLRFNELFTLLRLKPIKNPLMEYCGIEDSKTGHVSENVDEIYQTD